VRCSRTANDAELLEKAGIESFKDPRFQKYSDRLKKLRAIKDYPYVVHVLERAMSYEEVTEIFVRVNSLGAKLKSSDLALAQMTSRWPNLLKELEVSRRSASKSWFTIDLGHLVRAIVVFATKQCLFRSVATTPVEKLKAGWAAGAGGLRFAINFLRSNAGIEDESLLSMSNFAFLPAEWPLVAPLKRPPRPKAWRTPTPARPASTPGARWSWRWPGSTSMTSLRCPTRTT
jgi:hypothetical protein